MSTPYGQPSTTNPADKPQSPHIIPPDEYSIYSEPSLPIIACIQSLPLLPTKDPTTEPSDETIHKNYVEPLSICTLNLVQKYSTNLPPVPT